MSIKQILKLQSNSSKALLVMFFSSLYLYSHVGTLYQQERGLNLVQVSSITSIIIGTIFLAEVPTGILADKIGRKWSVVISLILQAIGEYWYYFASSYISFVLIAVLAGIGFAFQSGALEALIYDSLPEKNREKQMTKMMGNLGAVHQAAFIIAPLLGSIIVRELTISYYLKAILATAFSVTAAVVISFTFKEPASDFDGEEKSPMQILRKGLRIITRNRDLKRIILISIFTFAFAGYLSSIYQPYFAENGIVGKWPGIALSLAALGAALSQKSSLFIEEKIGKRKAIFLFSILPALGYIFLGLVSDQRLIFLFFILTYSFADMKNPILSAYQNERIPGKVRATTLSLINMFKNIYVSISGIIIGLGAEFSVGKMFVLLGIFIFIVTVFLWRFNRHNFTSKV